MKEYREYRIGIDVGGTKTACVIMGDREVIAKKKLYHKSCKTPSEVADHAAEGIRAMLSELAIPLSAVTHCGVGVPGSVNDTRTTVLSAPNLGWKNVPLADMLLKKLGLVPTLLQDTRASAIGEYLAGSGNDASMLVVVTLGTGIGCGVISEGTLIDGGHGFSGELGHFPTGRDGIRCPCGGTDCMELYSSGHGIFDRARDAGLPVSSCEDVFHLAREGNESAKNVIATGVDMLSRALASVANLLSPDVMLFAGGLAKEQSYVNEITEALRKRTYPLTAEKMRVESGALDEWAPAVGAALADCVKMKTKRASTSTGTRVSASVMCADLLSLGDSLRELEAGACDYLHCDVMDGHFVPNFMMFPDMINRIREVSPIPLDVHLMTDKPELAIASLKLRRGDIVSVHAEAVTHLQRLLQRIKETGATAAVALNPATPLSALDYVLDDIGMVLVMSVNPGFAGQKLVPQVIEKIRDTREYLDRHGKYDVMIEVDGNCNYENSVKMVAAGADILVSGSSGVFKKDTTVKDALMLFKSIKR